MATNLMTDVSQFWSPYETKIDSIAAFIKYIGEIHSRHGDCRFVWRGAMDHRWGMLSSLYRRVWWSKGFGSAPPNEGELAKEEERVLEDARSWGLHSGERGLVSGMETLAMLQHYGIPTRLIDVTFSPLIALFFAVESGSEDGRLFAVGVGSRFVNSDISLRRAFETPLHLPWQDEEFRKETHWNAQVHVWRPAGFDRRILAQNGAFLVGGVPTLNNQFQAWSKQPSGSSALRTNDVRACVSVPIRLNKDTAKPGPGRIAEQPFYAIRVPATNKEEIRRQLGHRFSIEHSTVYPDAPGMQAHGTKWLTTFPPKPPK